LPDYRLGPGKYVMVGTAAVSILWSALFGGLAAAVVLLLARLVRWGK
jgi:hypothetical protein